MFQLRILEFIKQSHNDLSDNDFFITCDKVPEELQDY